MLQDMTQTIMRKGKQNQRLSEIVNSFKNQLIIDQIFEQSFLVQMVTNMKSIDLSVSSILAYLLSPKFSLNSSAINQSMANISWR